VVRSSSVLQFCHLPFLCLGLCHGDPSFSLSCFKAEWALLGLVWQEVVLPHWSYLYVVRSSSVTATLPFFFVFVTATLPSLCLVFSKLIIGSQTLTCFAPSHTLYSKWTPHGQPFAVAGMG